LPVAILAGVVALALAWFLLAGGNTPGTPAATLSASAPAPIAAAPTNLKATAGPFAVVLRWREGTGGTVDVSRYTISRNGRSIALASEGALHYVDRSALPMQTYRYSVQGVGADSTMSEEATVRVTTPKAPLSAARLEGVFNMKFRITSSYNVHGFGGKTEGWEYRPKCSSGPCLTALEDIHWKKFATNLRRSGGTYTSAFPFTGYMYCSHTPDSGTVEIDLHVTKAKTLHGAWAATALRGTQKVTTGAGLGCASAGLTYEVTGTLAG